MARINVNQGVVVTNPMPPGWYDDPDGSPNAERRWDGFSWTPERRRKATRSQPSNTKSTPTPSYPPPPQWSNPSPAQTPPPNQSVPPPGIPQPPIQAPSYPQPAPPQYPHPPYPLTGPSQPNQTFASNLFSTIAFVCAGLAALGGLAVIAPLPTIFGIAAIICAVVALTKKERLAPFAIGAAIGGLLIGWLLQAVLWDVFLY